MPRNFGLDPVERRMRRADTYLAYFVVGLMVIVIIGSVFFLR